MFIQARRYEESHLNQSILLSGLAALRGGWGSNSLLKLDKQRTHNKPILQSFYYFLLNLIA